ncbi:MAG TPA: hypothetical protein VF576_12935 [Rubricoccaceae bacterium]
MYLWLCEFVHPNWSGVLGSYAKCDRASIPVTFGRRFGPEVWEWLDYPLRVTLRHFCDRYNETALIFPDLVLLCERDMDATSEQALHRPAGGP